MVPVRGVIGWLPLVLFAACIASHPGERRAGTERPAVDRLLNRGDIQVAEAHLQDFGFDPGPVRWRLYGPDARGSLGLPGQIWPPDDGTPRLHNPPPADPGAGLR
jgi:hypothetical protein